MTMQRSYQAFDNHTRQQQQQPPHHHHPYLDGPPPPPPPHTMMRVPHQQVHSPSYYQAPGHAIPAAPLHAGNIHPSTAQAGHSLPRYFPSPSALAPSSSANGSHYFQHMPHHPGYAGSPPYHASAADSQSPPHGLTGQSYHATSSVQGAPSSSRSPPSANANSKSVVRAACLSCRSAKRRCDGGQPVCGPCLARGVSEESGGCQYVASKRGGPRFKGCTGEEARKIKADKERQKMEQIRRMSTSPPPSSPTSGSMRRPSQQGRTSSYADESSYSTTSNVSHDTRPTVATTDHLPLHDTASLTSRGQGQSHQFASTSHNPSFESDPRLSSGFPGRTLSNSSPQEERHQQPWPQTSKPQSALDFLADIPVHPASGHNNTYVNGDTWKGGSASTGADGQASSEVGGLSGFYSRLELLPKAGPGRIDATHDDGGDSLMALDALLPFDPELEPHLLDAADSEQQARFLLGAFFETVYPSAPVLLAPENLSSLAFWFSGKGPCALYAAISALVTLRLPENEAHRTLRGGYQKAYGGETKDVSSRAEIAAHHALVSDFLLKRFSQQQAAAAAASFGLDPKALSTGCDPDETGRSLCQGPSDPELLRIEAAAAHTLLAHYFYGAGGKGGQKKAHEHALEAWGSLQGIRIELQEGIPPRDPLTTSHFNWEQKQEWAKRVYWTSYGAASVTAATGGFRPINFTLDAVAALKMRPALESDVGAWGVYIRGAQHVARGYNALYEFEALKTRKDLSDEEIAREKARIFHAFSKLDQDMTAFCTYDPAWRSPTNPTSGLGFALRTAGKLMTAGATIIIHRGQAYANAHIFMNAQCGLPEAVRCSPHSSGDVPNTGAVLSALASRRTASDDDGADRLLRRDSNGVDGDHHVGDDAPGSPSDAYVPPDRLWHRSGSTSLPPAGSGSGSFSGGPHNMTGGALEPSVAALDATFIGWGSSAHANNGGGVHGVSPGPGGVGGNGSSGSAAPSPASAYEGPTRTAMLAFQQFQAQQQVQRMDRRGANREGRGSSVSVSSLHDLASLGLDGGAVTTPPIPSPQLADERYKFGPFEPEVSASKCRWAAQSMLESIPPLLQGVTREDGKVYDAAGSLLSSAPALPPWASCSYVLASYCLLMQCLVTQSSRALRSSRTGSIVGAEAAGGSDEVDKELRVLRGQVTAVHNLLARFAQTIEVAWNYQKEVAVLLEVNRRLP